ncbi:hypothetical protein VTP01DRAFT_4917 [Rhizomucor pusillus]|uniref:uncharacterized protein n=1 Tax=Rhizomucor pusillus TaxID=4840 RepID=UPI0037449FFC
MNRGPIVLTIDEAEYLLDQIPPPEKDEDPTVTKLRQKLSELLTELRKGAEGRGKL